MSSYTRNLCKPSDIQEHLGLLHGLAQHCGNVVELGFRQGISTSAFLAAGVPVHSYDIDKGCRVWVKKLAAEYPKTFVFKCEDSRKAEIPECDLLFIDTDHTYATTKIELERHHRKALQIILHDTCTYAWKDRPPGKGKGIMTAVHEFCDEDIWEVQLHLNNCNGLTILERRQ